MNTAEASGSHNSLPPPTQNECEFRCELSAWRDNLITMSSSPVSLEEYVIHVYMPNKSFKAVRFNVKETVFHVIRKTVEDLGRDGQQQPSIQRYACRMLNMITKEVIWLARSTSMQKVLSHILTPGCSNVDCPNSQAELDEGMLQHQEHGRRITANRVWRVELRVRYVPNSIQDLFDEDKATCFYYFNQVTKSD